MHLLHGSLVDRHFDGTLGPDQSRAMFERVWSCAKCRQRYERQLVFEAARPGGAVLGADRLWQSIAVSAGTTRPSPARAERRRKPQLFVLTATLAGALAALVPFALKTSSHSDPVARGDVAAPATAPSVHLYRTRNGASAPLDGELRPTDGVLVAYSNPSTDLRYLMLFGVDGRGGVHWYYPGYEHLGEDPSAVPIRTGALGVELGEEVRHDLPTGDLRMFALFLPQPRRVLEIETVVSRALTARGGSVRALTALDIPDGTQSSILLEVRP